MLRILSTGSSSAGNNYILDCEGQQLLIEAGIGLKVVRRALDYDMTKIIGCICTHEHGDHFAYAAEYAGYGIPVYATRGTLSVLSSDKVYGLHTVEYKQLYEIGGFRVKPFHTEHDAAEPCGFLIDCPDGNRVLFATDTYYLRYKFPDVSVYLIECNYDESILQTNIKHGIVHPSVGERVRKSHMSINQCVEMLKANDLSKVKAIFLIHLSGDNSRADSFKKRVEEATGKVVYIATPKTNTIIF